MSADEIYNAIVRKNDQVLEIIKTVTDINMKIKNRDSILHYAVYYKNSKVIEYLFNHSVDIHATGQYDRTALHVAVLSRNMYAMDSLLSLGVDINAKQYDGWTALHLAAYNNDESIIIYLLENGANYSIRNHRGHLARDKIDNERLLKVFDITVESLCSTIKPAVNK